METDRMRIPAVRRIWHTEAHTACTIVADSVLWGIVHHQAEASDALEKICRIRKHAFVPAPVALLRPYISCGAERNKSAETTRQRQSKGGIVVISMQPRAYQNVGKNQIKWLLLRFLISEPGTLAATE